MTRPEWEDDDWTEAVCRVAGGDPPPGAPSGEAKEAEKPWTVQLTPEEVDEAEVGGAERHFQAVQMGLREQDGLSYEEGEKLHQKGAVGEFAVAKFFGVKWSPKILKKELIPQADVADLEVRSTVMTKRLLRFNKTGTKTGVPYVLVVRHPNRVFELAGWLYGEEGLKPEYWGKHYYRRPGYTGWDQFCYGVPEEKLRPMAELVRKTPPTS